MATKAAVNAASERKIVTLERRIKALEAQIDELLTAAPVSEIVRRGREGPELQAWPPDLADGQVLTAAHVNSIKNSVSTWGGDVNASNYQLNNVGQIHMTGLYLTNASIHFAFYKKADDPQATGFYWRRSPTGGTADALDLMILRDGGALEIPYLQGFAGAAGSKRLWYDPADGNRVKFTP
jgi:hypothetical protein